SLKSKMTARSLQAVDLEKSLTNTVLNLDKIDLNLYRGTNLWKPLHSRAVFGGQVVGQALVAATKTVADNMHVHSLHCYFVNAGDNRVPIIHHVDRVRDGKSFCTRSVKANQQGTPILTMQVSFHINENGGFSHQYTMPDVPKPDDLLSSEELTRKYLETEELSAKHRAYLESSLAVEVPMEMRPVNPFTFYARRIGTTVAHEPKQMIWIRASGHLDDDPAEMHMNLHRCLAAYISDFSLLGTATLPHPDFRWGMGASLDHSMWFHTPFRADEWMLYECESPQAGGNRALVCGRLWKQDGTLAVTVTQEGLLRPYVPQDKSKL
ncbi:unnamed protein product, partial [Owenia fusiformis]